ncbi:FadR/GntR family transcriptional regulator [Bordetella petrii]|uniref:Transcriptional regulator, GntR-family n=1 Tax=Bordetella petrii (strain ATCC BAA-461 / DSM 12804 / CCUG 43448 / CIP 107267 / Se-1111R) TaxID=340100 RepID=A9ILI2_BORPD|nr:FCD domain-containing protein [Bordetella petrii]CAP42587.1 transcriptional regulator, GntR-family [Bordetella petrii]
MDDLVAGRGLRAEGAKALAHFLMESMASGRLREGMRLPPERALSERFGASRGSVRRVLAELRERGLIVQAVGSGTFVAPGVHAVAPAAPGQAGLNTSPAELMQARLLIEPLMPMLIARNATGADFARMGECLERSEAAASIEDFEHWDGELHKAFAAATHNTFFLQILELANRVREQGEWGRLKSNSLTPERREQYQQQHRAIVAALKDRDAGQARVLLLAHLEQIQQNLFG